MNNYICSYKTGYYIVSKCDLSWCQVLYIHTRNIKLWKFILKVFWSILWKVAPVKISRCTVISSLKTRQVCRSALWTKDDRSHEWDSCETSWQVAGHRPGTRTRRVWTETDTSRAWLAAIHQCVFSCVFYKWRVGEWARIVPVCSSIFEALRVH